jgi:formylglycine-generating enzyme required for sulfatase activity
MNTKTHPVDGTSYVYVPAGKFMMGSNDYDDEKPIHEVELAGFWIMQTPVTNEQYSKGVAAGACRKPNNQRWNQAEYAQHPVTHVDWQQASDYAAWAGGRLPTEAEWEKAARGTDGRTYPWGNDMPTAQFLNFNYSKGDTTAVGSYAQGASPYGALDMAGNVWEWTADWYAVDYYENSPAQEPPGPAEGSLRTLRGGSFYNIEDDVRCAYRGYNYPNNRNYNVGFRVVSPGF